MPTLHDSGNADPSATFIHLHTFIHKSHETYLCFCNDGKLTLKSCAISRTSLWNGSFLIKSSVLFWYFRISLHSKHKSKNKQGVSVWFMDESVIRLQCE
ncbi:hypothetical protein HanIR_Chr15g0767341 [Helianthus annuus]|nr:hypothetical protein HanIR_Chr15g0767341 [Helianthus annuus]